MYICVYIYIHINSMYTCIHIYIYIKQVLPTMVRFDGTKIPCVVGLFFHGQVRGIATFASKGPKSPIVIFNGVIKTASSLMAENK